MSYKCGTILILNGGGMRKAEFKVVAMWDSEAEVWYVSETDVPGLNAEGETLDELLAELRILVPELLILNGVITAQDKNGIEVPWELVSLHQEKIRAAC